MVLLVGVTLDIGMCGWVSLEALNFVTAKAEITWCDLQNPEEGHESGFKITFSL